MDQGCLRGRFRTAIFDFQQFVQQLINQKDSLCKCAGSLCQLGGVLLWMRAGLCPRHGGGGALGFTRAESEDSSNGKCLFSGWQLTKLALSTSLSGFQIFRKFTSDGGSSFQPINGATQRPPFCHPLMCSSKVLPGCQRLSSDTSAAINWGLKARRASWRSRLVCYSFYTRPKQTHQSNRHQAASGGVPWARCRTIIDTFGGCKMSDRSRSDTHTQTAE